METPRRRTQIREENPETAQEKMTEEQQAAEQPTAEQHTAERAAEEPRRGQAKLNVDGPGRCMKAVEAMIEHLSGARKTLMNAENCVVNRQTLQSQLAYLRENLPSSVSTAAKIVEEEMTLRAETRAWKERTEKEAAEKAQQTVSEANTAAQNLMDQANQEAAARRRSEKLT